MPRIPLSEKPNFDFSKTLDIVDKISRIGIVPVIKIEDTSKACELANALLNGGIDCAEVTFRADGADEVIRRIKAEYPEMLVGAGTVLNCEQADKAFKAGADFAVAPGLNPIVVKHSQDIGLPFIPGVATGSDIERAIELGLKSVKFFPAEQAGGINYIKALSAPYSDILFMPTGGINEVNIADYLSFNKVFACGGSWMVSNELIQNEQWERITELSRCAVDKVLGFEVAHIGINRIEHQSAEIIAKLFADAFGFSSRIGNSSIFSTDRIEIMKSSGIGNLGHIAIKTNSIPRAVTHLKKRGFDAYENSAKCDSKGKVVAVYLKQDFGGFAVHLLQK